LDKGKGKWKGESKTKCKYNFGESVVLELHVKVIKNQ